MDQLYVIGSSPSSGHRPIIIAFNHNEMLIIFIDHALHASFLISKFIYFVMDLTMDADKLYVIGSGPVCVCGPIIIALDHIEMLIVFTTHIISVLKIYLF